jgi:hypothetical protein
MQTSGDSGGLSGELDFAAEIVQALHRALDRSAVCHKMFDSTLPSFKFASSRVFIGSFSDVPQEQDQCERF